jgi:hypothetical protein
MVEHASTVHSILSSETPSQDPPTLSGVVTFLNLLLTPGPHLAEQEAQSDHSDHRHFGEIGVGDTVVTAVFLTSWNGILMLVLLSAKSNVKFFVHICAYVVLHGKVIRIVVAALIFMAEINWVLVKKFCAVLFDWDLTYI